MFITKKEQIATTQIMQPNQPFFLFSYSEAKILTRNPNLGSLVRRLLGENRVDENNFSHSVRNALDSVTWHRFYHMIVESCFFLDKKGMATQ
jgi:hypothetical protein